MKTPAFATLRDQILEVLGNGHTAAYDLRDDILAILEGNEQFLNGLEWDPEEEAWVRPFGDSKEVKVCPNGPNHKTQSHPVASPGPFPKSLHYEPDEFCSRCGTSLSGGAG